MQRFPGINLPIVSTSMQQIQQAYSLLTPCISEDVGHRNAQRKVLKRRLLSSYRYHGGGTGVAVFLTVALFTVLLSVRVTGLVDAGSSCCQQWMVNPSEWEACNEEEGLQTTGKDCSCKEKHLNENNQGNVNYWYLITKQSLCYSRTVTGTRRCNCTSCANPNHNDCKGKFDMLYCCGSEDFIELLRMNASLVNLQKLADKNKFGNLTVKERAYHLQRFARSHSTSKVNKKYFKQFLDSCRTLMSFSQTDTSLERDNRTSVGTLLLQTLDELALKSVDLANESNRIFEVSGSIGQISRFKKKHYDTIIGIDDLNSNFILLPPEVLGDAAISETFVNESRIVSYIHYNVSELLPPRNENASIITPIISSTTNCASCVNGTLKNNVTVGFYVQGAADMVENGSQLSCIFFEIENLEDDFPTGEWNRRGCTITVGQDHVNCSCNHLTHFAILLSPGVETNKLEQKVLTLFGVYLVPVSLVCLLLVILTYSCMRSLWSLRNYVHIMLCVSLFIAQLTFMIGIDQTENVRTCSGIAVVLQYLFLVTFMWMLMEGVVLYVTLVTVFVENHLRYVIGFTITCYAVPAVYMCVTTPIGFLVGVDNIPGHTHYLYYDEQDQLQACWLNYKTYFILSFILPVVIILLINAGFFIMAITIIRKHSQKDKARNGGYSSVTVKHWIKVSISLMVVMGFSWFGGIVVFLRQLLFIGYIMTAFMAGQGIIFFLLLVPLCKQVRESYAKLWKKQKMKSNTIRKLSRLFSIPSSSKKIADQADSGKTESIFLSKDSKSKQDVSLPDYSCNEFDAIQGETADTELQNNTEIAITSTSSLIKESTSKTHEIVKMTETSSSNPLCSADGKNVAPSSSNSSSPTYM